MAKKIYVRPETEVVILNTNDQIMFEFDPEGSTQEQLGNGNWFDEDEGGDSFFDD